MSKQNPFAAPQVDTSYVAAPAHFVIKRQQDGLLLEDMVTLPRFCVCCHRPAQFRQLYQQHTFWSRFLLQSAPFQMQFWQCWRHYCVSLLAGLFSLCLNMAALIALFVGFYADVEWIFFALVFKALAFLIKKHAHVNGRLCARLLSEDLTYIVTGFNQRFLARFRESAVETRL